VPNGLKLRPKHFSKGGEKFSFALLYGHAYLGANCAPVPTPSSPDKTIQPSQSKVLCTKERDDIRPQTKSVRAPVVFGLYCPSSQNLIKKILHELTVNSQGWLNPFSRIVGFSVTRQLHIITSPDT